MTSTTKLFRKYLKEVNPVTKSVYRNIIKNRISRNREKLKWGAIYMHILK